MDTDNPAFAKKVWVFGILFCLILWTFGFACAFGDLPFAALLFGGLGGLLWPQSGISIERGKP